MIKRLTILMIICAFNLICAQEKGKTVIGKWIGTDERNQTGGIEFLINGKVKLLMFGKEMPTSEYKIDYGKNPIAINLSFKKNGKTMILYGLLKFIDSNTIKWEVFPMANKQPTTFSLNTESTAVILKRS